MRPKGDHFAAAIVESRWSSRALWNNFHGSASASSTTSMTCGSIRVSEEPSPAAALQQPIEQVRRLRRTAQVMNPADALALAKCKTRWAITFSEVRALLREHCCGVCRLRLFKATSWRRAKRRLRRGCRLWFREDATIEVSSEHGDYFIRNLLAVRAEGRIALAINQPAYFAKAALLPETLTAAASVPAHTSKK